MAELQARSLESTEETMTYKGKAEIVRVGGR
jgi:hypothetical protein